MTKEDFSESDINYICNKISNQYSNENIHFQAYIENLLQKIRKFLKQKKKSPNFKPDEFVKNIINHISSRKVEPNTHVGILAAQSIGEPVTQSALSYFHKLAGDDTINGLKELYNITHNKTELSVAEFYLKPGKYDEDSRERIISSFKYITLNDIVVDVVYDGFNLRFYLYSHTIFNFRLHPYIVQIIIKKYLKESNSILEKWDSSVDLDHLYIEFKNPASKTLDWLDSNGIEYIVDEDILCVYKVKEKRPNPIVNLENDDDHNDKYASSSNEENKNEGSNEKKIHNRNKNNEESHTENKNEPNMTNDSLLDYFKLNNLTYEEKEKYFILNSNYIKIKYEEIIKLLNDITLAGTKGVKTVTPKMLGKEEFYVEVVGKDLDPLFKNPYIDLDRSRYIVYGNSKEVDYNTRKQNILTQLERITNIDKSFYNNQHIELLNNFMCRNNTVVPMSRFGMKNDDYSFISKLSFEDPYSVMQNILYGVEDNLSSVSAKIITGIYNDKI